MPARDPVRADVVVAGGGAAGFAAAVGAAREGARTILLERGPCLGGAATLRNVLTFAGLHTRDGRQVVHGVAEDVLAGLRGRDAVSGPTRFTATSVVFDPEALKTVLDTIAREAGVQVLLHTQVIGARRDGDVVAAVSVADHSGVRDIEAAAFVDGTGEADLAAHAGVEVRYGNHGQVQNGTLGVRFGGVPADVRLDRDVLGTAVRAARDAGAGQLLADAGLVARLPVSGDVITYLVDEAYDARDALDTSRAEASARRQAQAYLDVLRTVPGCAGAFIASTGPELGTRESRHVVACRQLTEAEVLGACQDPDAVAVGCWPVEYHPGPGAPAEWRFLDDPGHYAIPLDVLRSRDAQNLLVAGRAVDGDRGAGASLRVMGTAFATGHAAGVAAALLAAGVPPHPALVRQRLQLQGARLPEPHPTLEPRDPVHLHGA